MPRNCPLNPMRLGSWSAKAAAHRQQMQAKLLNSLQTVLEKATAESERPDPSLLERQPPGAWSSRATYGISGAHAAGSPYPLCCLLEEACGHGWVQCNPEGHGRLSPRGVEDTKEPLRNSGCRNQSKSQNKPNHPFSVVVVDRNNVEAGRIELHACPQTLPWETERAGLEGGKGLSALTEVAGSPCERESDQSPKPLGP